MLSRPAGGRIRAGAICAILATLGLFGCDETSGPQLPGPVASLEAEPEFPRNGITGEPLGGRPAVRALDAAGRPVPGVEVRFAVETGGGSIDDGTAVTDSSGVATSGYWTLGPRPGSQTLSATARAEDGTEVRTIIEVGASWRWTEHESPLGGNLSGLHLHPLDDSLWHGLNIQEGVARSTDGGASWTLVIEDVGINGESFKVDPANPDTIFAGVRNHLLVSGDRGATWSLRHVLDFDLWIRSIEILADGTLLVGPQWPEGRDPGVFRSEDRGVTWSHHSYGVNQGQRVLTWVLRQDPATGVVWSGNEIADHPQPYRPPFLRSDDGGRTWTDYTARLPFPGNPWHIIDVASSGSVLYALSEGAGLFRSVNGGNTWQNVGRAFAASLLVDPRLPGTVFGGDFGDPFGEGDVMVSFDNGTTFTRAGRLRRNVASLSLTSDARRLIVATWGGGIHVAELPEVLP